MVTKPNFFLLGGAKCGTTALASYLATHPSIYVSNPKEPHYFCKDLKAGGLPIASDSEYLQTFFPGLDNSGAIAALDASVWYLYSRIAIREILYFEPEARFLVMLRNPIDMVWSLHSMLTFQGQENQNDFLRAWSLQEKRQLGLSIPSGLWLDHRMLFYKDVCSLGTQLQMVFHSVGRECVHVELQDDLKSNSRDVYLRVLNFIGVPDDGRQLFPIKNAGRKISNPVMVSLLRSRVAVFAVKMVKSVLGLRTLGFGRPDLPMPNAIRRFLVKEFEDEILLLEKLIGRNLSHWRYVPKAI